jgi:transposase
MRGQPGLFDVDGRLQRLTDLGDQLLACANVVDFELFRPELTRALAYPDGTQDGRRPFDPVMMFKVLVIQAANNLSDERAEFLINDRLSFMRFLGLGLSDRVPDARTIWLYREKLTKAEAIKPLFAQFDAALRAAGYIAKGGQIVDASLVSVPKQRNTEAKTAVIKEGRIPEDWKAKPAKHAHKDRDARWTVEFSKPERSRTERCRRPSRPPRTVYVSAEKPLIELSSCGGSCCPWWRLLLPVVADQAKASFPIFVRKPLASLWRAPVSSTAIQPAVARPVRDTARASVRNRS